MSLTPEEPAPTPSPEATPPVAAASAADEPLHRPKLPFWRRVGGEGLVTSIIIHVLLILLAAIWVISTITDQAKKDPNTFATGAGGGANGEKAKEFKTRAQPKNPKTMAKMPSRITSKSATASIAVPDMPALNTATLTSGLTGGGSSKGFGGGTGGGIGSGTGIGRGNARNFVSLFGAKGGVGGVGLIGTFYDLKQTSAGGATKMAPHPAGIGPYRAAVREFLEHGWSPASFIQYYKAPDALVTGQLYIPSMAADGAPKAYGVEKKVQPSRWVVHYKGTIEVPQSMPFRFVGSGDDWLIVRWNKKIALDDGYETYTVHREGKETVYKDFKQKTEDEFKVNRLPGFLNRLKAGPWITAQKGELVEIEILMGETPGGVFDVYLAIEVAKSASRTNGTFVGEGKLKLFRCNTEPLPEELLRKPHSKDPKALDPKRGLDIDMQAEGWIFRAKRQSGPVR